MPEKTQVQSGRNDCVESGFYSSVRRINATGGELDPSARGVDEDDHSAAGELGVTKIDIDTDGRLVWTRVHREHFRDHPQEFDLRPPGKIFVRWRG